MSRKSLWAIAISVLLPACLGTLPLRAANGWIPVAAPNVTLNTSGNYILTRDLTDQNNGNPVITLGAPDITLDLNGHTISVASGDYGIYASGQGQSITVFNGAIVGGQIGLADSYAAEITLHDLFFSGQSGQAVQLYGNNTTGTTVPSVENLRVIGSGSSEGISMDYVNSAQVEHCVVTQCTDGLSAYDCNGGRFLHNTLSHCAVGVYMDHNWAVVVADNTITDSTSYGVEMSMCTGDVVRGNNISGDRQTLNSPYGVYLASGADNTFDWNLINDHTDPGLEISAGTANVYAFNRWANDGLGGVDAGTGNIDGGDNY
ncbi:MAG: right-handed parallel beta-helix repeat-containing protein [Acidobacteriota bacterium]|jgi:hypothetical protein